MKFDFRIAGPDDDADIRRLLAANPMPGRLTVAFEREPDFFVGEAVRGSRWAVLLARDAKDGTPAGIVSIAAADRWIGGRIRPVGYIGQVRVASEYRGRYLPLQAAAPLRSLVRDGWPEFWLAAIVSGNPAAEGLFYGRAPASFPKLRPVTRVHTLGLLTPRRTAPPRSLGAGRRISSAGERGFAEVAAFLEAQGPRRQFYPRYDAGDFGGGGRFPGLGADDMLVLLEGNRIIGCAGVWDQSSFKQTVVRGYSTGLRLLRPVLNLLGPPFGAKRLPEIGEELSAATLCALAVENDDPEAFDGLLQAALAHAAVLNRDYLLAGFAVDDPLLAAARRRRHIRYTSTLYAFGFDEDPIPDVVGSDRPAYVEIGAL